MMKKIYVGALLASMLTQPVFGMEEDRQDTSTNAVNLSDQEQKELNTQLLDAATNGDLSLVKQLVKQGAIANDSRYVTEWTDIVRKSYKDNVAMLKLLFCQDHPLIEAIKAGDLVGVDQLLNDGANVNEEKCYGSQLSPLTWACIDGNVQIVKRLLACKDIQVNIIDKSGHTPLFHAYNKRHVDVIKLLLEHKDIQVNISFHPNTKIRMPLNTLLMLSKEGRDIEILKLFLAHKDIELGVKAKSGFNSLHAACLGGSSEKVKLILKSVFKPAISWQQARLVLIGHQQEDGNFANLPMEIIQHIFSFCGDRRKNIEKLRHFICSEANEKTPFDCAKDNVKKELGHILDPKSWQDDQIAEKTYAQLLTLLKEYGVQEKEEDDAKKRKRVQELELETKKVKKEKPEENGKEEQE